MGARVQIPDASDQSEQASFKRLLIERSHTILDAGNIALSGTPSGKLTVLLGTESDEIENVLYQDSEREAFQYLIHHATVAQQLINDQ